MKDSNGVITHFCFFPWEVPTTPICEFLGKTSWTFISSLPKSCYPHFSISRTPHPTILYSIYPSYSFKYTYINIINIYASQNIKNNACSLHFGASALYVIGLRVISYENLITSEISWMLKRNSNIWFQTENSIFLLVGACDKASSKTSVYI